MRYLFFLLLISSCAMADNIAAAKINSELGFTYLSKGLYVPAKERFLMAIQEGPAIAESWYGMAYFYEKTGDSYSAENYYKKALRVEPHSGAAKNNYGAFLCREKRYDSAIHFFISAANELTYLHASSAYTNAGLCAIKLRDYNGARLYFKNALHQNPQNKLARIELKKFS